MALTLTERDVALIMRERGPIGQTGPGGSEVNVASRQYMATISLSAGAKYAFAAGGFSLGDGGQALYKRVSSEPTHEGKVRSLDRYLPNGTIDAGNGGWWELAENLDNINPAMFGGTPGGTVDGQEVFIQQALDFVSAKLTGGYRTGKVSLLNQPWLIDDKVLISGAAYSGIKLGPGDLVANDASGAWAYDGVYLLSKNLILNGKCGADISWTKGTGWAFAVDRFTKTAGVASSLTQALIAAAVIGDSYRITFRIAGRTAGSMTAKLTGGAIVTGTARATNGTFVEDLVATAAHTTFDLASETLFNGSITLMKVERLIKFAGHMLEVRGTAADVDISEVFFGCNRAANGLLINTTGSDIIVEGTDGTEYLDYGIKIADGTAYGRFGLWTQWHRSDDEFDTDVPTLSEILLGTTKGRRGIALWVDSGDCAFIGVKPRWCGIPILLDSQCKSPMISFSHPYNGSIDQFEYNNPTLMYIREDVGRIQIINNYLDFGKIVSESNNLHIVNNTIPGNINNPGSEISSAKVRLIASKLEDSLDGFDLVGYAVDGDILTGDVPMIEFDYDPAVYNAGNPSPNGTSWKVDGTAFTDLKVGPSRGNTQFSGRPLNFVGGYNGITIAQFRNMWSGATCARVAVRDPTTTDDPNPPGFGSVGNKAAIFAWGDTDQPSWTVEKSSDGRALSPTHDGLQDIGLAASSVRSVYLKSVFYKGFTIATLPTVGADGRTVYCSDLGGGGALLIDEDLFWRRVGKGGRQVSTADGGTTRTVLTDAEDWFYTGTLTANRTITLATTNAYSGARFRFTRTGGGAFNLNVGGLKNLNQNQWADVVYSGSAWELAAFGSL